MWEWMELCFGVLAGEGVMETVGTGGERGMEVCAAVKGPREAGTTPVGAVLIAPGERVRFTACR